MPIPPGDLSLDDLRELVIHYAVYLGWPLGRCLNDVITRVAAQVDAYATAQGAQADRLTG